MELALLIYGISLLPGLKTIFGFLIVIGCVLTVFGIIMFFVWHDRPSWYNEQQDSDRLRYLELSKPIFKFGVGFVILSSVFSLMIPSEKTAWMMVGGYAGQTLVTNDTVNKAVSETSSKLLTIINNKLDGYVEETTKQLEKATAKQ